MPARMKVNENFSGASIERFYAVRINHMTSPNDGIDVKSPPQQPSLFQVVHRYVYTVV